jgi:hypothetical protein
MFNDFMTAPIITGSQIDDFMIERLLAEPMAIAIKAKAVEYRLKALL